MTAVEYEIRRLAREYTEQVKRQYGDISQTNVMFYNDGFHHGAYAVLELLSKNNELQNPSENQ